MGHNISREKRRTALMGLPLRDLRAWHLVVRCQACTDDRYLPIAVLIERYGSEHTLSRIVPRMRCQFRTCGQPPAVVRLFSSLERDAQCVVLVGPGAY